MKKITLNLKIKVNKNLGRYKKCSVVYLTCDKNGIPLDKFMRMNLDDFVANGDIEILKTPKKEAPKTPTKRRIKHDDNSFS